MVKSNTTEKHRITDHCPKWLNGSDMPQIFFLEAWQRQQLTDEGSIPLCIRGSRSHAPPPLQKGTTLGSAPRHLGGGGGGGGSCILGLGLV